MELILQERSSQGIVKDYFNSSDSHNSTFNTPPYLYKTLMDMVKADPILFTAVNLTVDMVTYRGYTFIGKNERAIKEAYDLFENKLDFDQVIDNLTWQLITFGDAFLEIRWNKEKTEVMELHPLDSSEMRIKYDEHGEVLAYVQEIEGKAEIAFPVFATDEVIHFRMHWIGSQVYSHAPFQAIARPFATRVYANDYLSSIFRNVPPKIIYFLKNASKDQKKMFFENLIRAKTNPNMDIIAQSDKEGGFDAKMITPTFDPGLFSAMDNLRKEVLMITRVPPHWVGMLDGANRGIGENVVIPYETKVKKIQQKLASGINKELMPKLKLNALEYKFNAISLMDEKTIVEVMNFLKAQGFDEETIVDYARNHGLDLRQGAHFELPPMATGSGQVLQNETAISRGDANPKANKLGNKLDSKGVSAEGGAKLQQKKVAA